MVIQREAFSLPFYCAGFAHREWMQVEYIMFFISCLLQMYKKEKMQENFCLTFSKKKNIMTFERVAKLRKSSFAALFCNFIMQ